jgi:uncharacterized protein (DUF697 family)
MHDIDTAQREYEAQDFESEYYESEAEYEDGFEFEEESESPLSEEQEMALAAELLEVDSEEELDQFIGSLIGIGSKLLPGIAKGIGGLFGRKRRKRGGRRMHRGRGKALGGALKGIAKTALPIVGGALGSVVPGLGTAIGGALGSAVGNMFEAELEGLNAEDQEFEQARRFVQLATTATQKAAAIPPNVDPRTAAEQAVTSAARAIAPASVKAGGLRPGPMRRGQSGRWMRRGNKIVVYGV